MTVKTITQTEWREVRARKMKVDAEAAEKERLRIEAAAEEMVTPFLEDLAAGEDPWGAESAVDVGNPTREYYVAVYAAQMIQVDWDVSVSDRSDDLSMDGPTFRLTVRKPQE